jgi:hypothetical protein
MQRASLVCSLFVIGTSLPVLASSADGRDGAVIRINVDVVRLDAAVTDTEGRHVTDLGRGDFEVRDGRRLRKIVSAT